MASKRATKARKLTKSKDYNTLDLSDVLCPICRTTLIEPVSLPCNHDFCLFCFEGTMENANLVCPLCRLRIGSWLRKVRKNNILINEDLWKVIKERFPQHVKNKLNGIDENIEEKREIVVSFPGEIRKEYEIQKQKEEDEQRREREEELKASEALIKKLKEEEEYEKALIEEKLKLDGEVAKKLSEELASKNPSTSKTKVTHKKSGPMDKFVKKDDETTSPNANSFMNKEYTCRVLHLDSRKSINESTAKEFSPKIHKKIKQIQKIADLETTSDGSDCIESEMRYFKPIDFRLNPVSEKKPPMKVIPKKLPRDVNAKVVSPNGLINFCSNILESAFAKFSIEIPKTPSTSKATPPQCTPKAESTVKRTLSPVNSEKPNKKLKQNAESECSSAQEYARKKLFGSGVAVSGNNESPPFYGFDRKKPVENSVRTNGSFGGMRRVENVSKKDQEQADLEFARRLQEEFDRCHFTRSTRTVGRPKKQKTLDDMIKSPYRVK